MVPTTTFTDTGPDVKLTRSPQQQGVWQNADLDADVFVMRCKRIDEPTRLGFPTTGYLMRASWVTDREAADIWWVKTLKAAEQTARLILTSRDDEPPPDLARLMSMCERRPIMDCDYSQVGVVPFKWLESEDTWCCPKCGWFE